MKNKKIALYTFLYFYILLVVEKLLLRNWLKMLPDALRHLYVVSLVLISWAIFALEDPAQLRAYLRAMIGMNGAPLLDPATLYYACADSCRSFLYPLGCKHLESDQQQSNSAFHLASCHNPVHGLCGGKHL